MFQYFTKEEYHIAAMQFERLVQTQPKAYLKLYLSVLQESGKTCYLLKEAHHLLAAGVSVIVGWIETYGRLQGEALLRSLPLVSRKELISSGKKYEIVDLQSIIARKPRVVVIDDLAHPNPPNLEIGKRSDEILELLQAGVSVIAAANVQYFASFAQTLGRMTGVNLQEQIPDEFLSKADQIVTLDFSGEELLRRVQSSGMSHRSSTALSRFGVAAGVGKNYAMLRGVRYCPKGTAKAF